MLLCRKWEQALPARIPVFFYQSKRSLIQRDPDRYRPILFCLVLNVLYRAINYIAIGHLKVIPDTTPDQALENKNVSLGLDFPVSRKIGFQQLFALFIGNIYRCPINNFRNCKILERIIGSISIIYSPQNKCPETSHKVRHSILSPLFWHTFRLLIAINIKHRWTLAGRSLGRSSCRIGILFVYVRILQEYRILIQQKIFYLTQHFRSQSRK